MKGWERVCGTNPQLWNVTDFTSPIQNILRTEGLHPGTQFPLCMQLGAVHGAEDAVWYTGTLVHAWPPNPKLKMEKEEYIRNRIPKIWEARDTWLPQSSQNSRCITSKIRRLSNGKSCYSTPFICFSYSLSNSCVTCIHVCYTCYTGISFLTVLKNEISKLTLRNI